MPSKLIRFSVAGLLAAIVSAGLPSVGLGEESVPSAQSPAAPASPAPATPAFPVQAPSGQTQSAPAPAAPGTQPPGAPSEPAANAPPSAPEAAKPGEPAAPQSEGSTGETVDLSARPFAYIEGKADRDEIYGAILGSLGLVKRDMDKAGLMPSGRPLAVFVESDDSGFRYHAGFPLDAAPADKASLSDVVKIGQTPSGKAMRFQHAGSYADIDATYDAITAYLDEKGIDAQDSFIEEYVNDVKDADDPALEVNIYVLLK
jgi:effector-binding domain-containing protein